MQSPSKLWPRLALSTALPALCLLPSATATQAATATSTFAVQMVLTAVCTVNSASALNFGSQGILTTNVDQTSTLQIQCSNTTPYNVGLDPGLGTGATVAVRKMTSGANTVNYTLYQDAPRSVVWGQTIGTDTQAGVGNGLAQSITVYGRVPTQTTPAPGSYSDTITVTVTY